MSKNYKLTPRQWRLYNFFKEQGDVWTTQQDVITELADWYPIPEINRNFHDSQARMDLTKDIRIINESSVIQKVVISSNRGCKIATEEEHKKYVIGELMATLEKLKRCKQKVHKGQMDGQYRIVLGQERDVIDSFLKAGGEENA